jgi:hypothetical protein
MGLNVVNSSLYHYPFKEFAWRCLRAPINKLGVIMNPKLYFHDHVTMYFLSV